MSTSEVRQDLHHTAATTTCLAREWARSQRKILAYIGSLVHDFNEAEELLQETAAQVFEHVDRYDDSRPFLPYVHGVARNVVLLHLRRSRKSRLIFDQDVIDRISLAFEQIHDQDAGVTEALEQCREKLGGHARRLCRMRYEEGLLPGEIARRLRKSTETVRVTLFRIRRQLKKCIEVRLRVSEEGVS